MGCTYERKRLAGTDCVGCTCDREQFRLYNCIFLALLYIFPYLSARGHTRIHFAERVCQEGISPTVSGSCGKDPLSPSLTRRLFQMSSRKGV